MLVRSQNNQRITDKIEFQAIKDGSGDWVILHIGGYKIFAVYSTLEKAIKALDMLERKYSAYGQLSNRVNGILGVVELPKVFQFPAEEEIPDEE